MMISRLVRKVLPADEISTPWGRAIVEERYTTLRRQVPIIYLLAVVNFSGLELAISGRLAPGFNLPTALAVCALIRIVQWLRPSERVDHRVMLARMRQTCWLTAGLSLTLCLWCLHLLQTQPSAHLAIILFGGLTGIGAAYGLSASPTAARMPLLVFALPLAGIAMFATDTRFLGAALSLAVVALLILRLLSVHNAHLTGLIRSRSTIARQQELAEHARQEAIVAATTDFLTGLPNRRAFVAALDAEICSTQDAGRFAVAVVDLDRFKVINDTFGHASGDKLLETVAERLVEAAGKTAVVARLGGDEFGLLFLDVASVPAVEAAVGRLLANVNRPATIYGRQFAVSACCGFGISRAGWSTSPSRVLADADLALYRAKAQGPGEAAIFEVSMEAPHRRRAQIERALQSPGVHENIHLVFQPIIDLRSGQVIANEALARWNDAELGDISPAEFVPIAEQLNVIGDISHHLMLKAFAEAAQWPSGIRLSFNLSAVQLCSAGSADAILAGLRTSGITADRLQVEVTETALLADFGRARENLAKLSSNGVTVVLDDFGAGYASISYLREMRFDQIKLDGALVTAAHDNADGERLLAAVIGLCNALGVSTVAEHIENERQVHLLLKLGCDAGQGFWLQAPMSPEAARHYSQAGANVATARREARPAPVRAGAMSGRLARSRTA